MSFLCECFDSDMDKDIRYELPPTRAKRKQVLNLLNERVKRNKLKLKVEPFTPLHPHNQCRSELIRSADQLKTTPMSKYLQRKILKQVKARNDLENTYPKIIPSIMQEATEDYYDCLHKLGVYSKIKPLENDRLQTVAPYKHPGRTANYPTFLERRRQIQSALLLHLKPVRRVHEMCVSLPEKFLHFRKFRRTTPLTLEEFQMKFDDRWKIGRQLVRAFYKSVVAALREDERMLRDTPKSRHCLRICTGLLSVHLSKSVVNTIEDAVCTIENERVVPLFDLRAVVEDDVKITLNVKPAPDDLIAYFSGILQQVTELTNDLPALESICNVRSKRSVPLFINEELFSSSRGRIERSFRSYFRPILDQTNELESEFCDIYSGHVKIVGDILDEDLSFDKGSDLIKFYRNYFHKLTSKVCVHYYSIGKLHQSIAITQLKERVSKLIDVIFGNLFNQHKFLNEDICDQFDVFKFRATKKPDTTEELMEMGEYMSWVNSVFVDELKQKVNDSLVMTPNLLELGTVQAEHMLLTVRAVRCVSEIQPLIDYNSKIQENAKADFEEYLQNKTEDVLEDVLKLMPYLVIMDDMDDADNASEYLIALEKFLAQIKTIDKVVSWINKEEVCFKFQQTTYAELTFIKNHIYNFYHLLKLCKEWSRMRSSFLDGPLEFLNFEDIRLKVENVTTSLMATQKMYKNVLRQSANENALLRFKGSVDDPDFMNLPAPLKLCQKVIRQIEDFKPVLRLMGVVCNDALFSNHWKEMSQIAEKDLEPNAGSTLRKYWDMDLMKNIEKYEIISASATKEKLILVSLQEMQREWSDLHFTLADHPSNRMILTDFDNIKSILDDHIIKTSNMQLSIFVKPHEKKVDEWLHKISKISSVIDELETVQQQYLYLLPLFSSPGIASQMPNEDRLFKEIDLRYTKFISKVQSNPKIIVTSSDDTLNSMVECNQLLETLNEGISVYLQNKKLYFPRFFFLSNAEILDTLAETQNPLRLQPFFKKCFDGIETVKFDDSFNILGMYSKQGEYVEFSEAISAIASRGQVEELFACVEKQMIASVRNYIGLCESSLVAQNSPEQIALVVSQITWTKDVHKSLHSKPELGNMLVELQATTEKLVRLIKQPNVNPRERHKTSVLLVQTSHQMQVVEDLHKQTPLTSEADFRWLLQLRYYWENGCKIRMNNIEVKYAYEYLGNTNRVVVTPATDRCFRALLLAHRLHANGALQGPSGAGKREMVLDLSKAIACKCVLFNCAPGMTHRTMTMFLKGAAASGSWVCFTNADRIRTEVLSTVAQQMQLVNFGLKSQMRSVVLEDVELKLDAACFVCVTLSPQYQGRVELPFNLRVLFRPVALMTPDYGLIARVVLHSNGFVDASVLSNKLASFYAISGEQLQFGKHYDYGIRSLNSILLNGIKGKINSPDDVKEDVLLLRALLEAFMPELLEEDIILFKGIISEVFPDTHLLAPENDCLVSKIKRACEARKLETTDAFVLKVIHVHETIALRRGCIIYGGTLTGKSSARTIVQDVIGEDHEILCLNPKSLTIEQMYGDGHRDGIVTTYLRPSTQTHAKWIVFDGPLEPEWVENLNTLLDEDAKLYLTSGEMLLAPQNFSLVFEVGDIAHASPSTTSRCGVVYMPDSAVPWKSLIQSWLLRTEADWCKDHAKYISNLFAWLIPPCVNFLRNCRQLCDAGVSTAVQNTSHFFEMCLNDAFSTAKKETDKYLVAWIQATCISAGVWGLGGALDADDRVRFDEFYRQMWRGVHEDYPYPENLEKLDVVIPPDGLLIDYVYIYRNRGNWKHWTDVAKSVKPDDSRSFYEILVPTLESEKYLHILQMCIRYKRPVILIGPPSTGKSFYINELFKRKLSEEEFHAARITLSVTSTFIELQTTVLSNLCKSKKGVYASLGDKTSLIFIDDVNLPERNAYGCQTPLELIRQMLDDKKWFDLKTLRPLSLANTIFLCSMSFKGTKEDICRRFLRHFSMFSINKFEDDSLVKIYTTILTSTYKKNGFSTEAVAYANRIVSATVDVFGYVLDNLKPTPKNFHYLFNLRDVAKVIYSCCNLRKEATEDRTIFAKLWVHEILRVFYDRLGDPNEKTSLCENLQMKTDEYFNENTYQIFEEGTLKRLIFGTYLNQKHCEDINISDLKNIAENCMKDYNISNDNKLDLVLFEYALENLSKICRIISMPYGNGILLGVSGCGRKSLSKLSTAILKYMLFQPNVTINYAHFDWRNDLKQALKEAGGGNQSVFLVSDEQLTDAFVQDVDYFLNGGDITNIYTIEEKKEILELVRLAAQGGNIKADVSSVTVFSFFSQRCKENLHLLLVLSLASSSLRKRFIRYPSLGKCCTVVCFEDWPDEALKATAQTWIPESKISDEIQESLIKACINFHGEARKMCDEFAKTTGRIAYVTPSSYLELLKTFTRLIKAKQTEISAAIARYRGGLQRLEFASDQIAKMTLELSKLKPELQNMSRKAAEMAKEIVREAKEVERASAVIKRDEEVSNTQAAEAEMLKSECEADLALAIPILEDAISALNTLKPSDITLVKSMKNPPNTIKLVMAAVCVIKDIKPDRIRESSTGRIILDYWGPSKRLLGEMNFLQQLKEFDKDDIKPEIIAKIRKEYLPHADFKPKIVAKASSAAEGLCKWIIAMDMYDKVAKEVAPKKAKLEQAEKQYATTMEILTEKKEQVAILEERLADLNENLRVAHLKQNELQEEVELCTNKLRRAEKLIGGLGGEKVRWTSRASELLTQYNCLAGDILVSSGIISYLSPFSGPYRNGAITEWHRFVTSLNIPTSADYKFTSVLSSDVNVQNWRINGLPNDDFAAQNAVIVDTCGRYPLMVDPQKQANLWIKETEKVHGLKVTKFLYPDYMETLEYCVEFGVPALLENVGEILGVSLDPILLKSTFKHNGGNVIRLGNKLVPFNADFRLYITSNIRKPHYLPEVFNKVTVINFSLANAGLQDQLLNIVVSRENPELQARKEDVLKENAKNKSELLKVEEYILKTLTESEGDISENEKAIQILGTSKKLSEKIKSNQIDAVERQISIDNSRSVYTVVANSSSLLYYCIFYLSNLNPVYRFSLEWFTNLYIKAIENSGKGRDVNKRLNSLINTISYSLYTNVCRSLLQKDRLLFSFVLCTKIMFSKQLLSTEDYQLFLTATNVSTLENSEVFRGLQQHLEENARDWASSTYDKLPKPWNSHLSNFQKLILQKIVKPDQLEVSVCKFVEYELGKRFTIPPQFSINESFNESTAITPLIFILSNDADPMSTLVSFARTKNVALQSVSLGKGQEQAAASLVEQGQRKGFWVCLQNCHVNASWLPELEVLWEKMSATNTRTNFRLWLTTSPIHDFPLSLLQTGIKISYEQPAGLRDVLRKLYSNEPVSSPTFYKGCPKEKTFTRLLYSLAFFHAVCHERKAFGSLGWNVPYLFNEADFVAAAQQLQTLVNDYDEPLQAIFHTLAESIYGGYVADVRDQKLLEALLENFVNPQVVNRMDYAFHDGYRLPLRNDYEDYLTHISQMGAVHLPEVFSLNHTFGATRNMQTTLQFLGSLSEPQDVSYSNGSTSHEYLKELCEDAMCKLPEEIVPGLQPPHLLLEVTHFNRLLEAIREDLNDVKKALVGDVILAGKLEDVAESMAHNAVPRTWFKHSYPSLCSFPTYLTNLVERIEFLKMWCDNGMPVNFWLSALFFPRAFLSYLKQTWAKTGLRFVGHAVLECFEETRLPEKGVYIRGLYLEGARWDVKKGVLQELVPGLGCELMPLVWIVPMRELKEKDSCYQCPVYRTKERGGNFVTEISLNVDVKSSHWVKRGVALLCEV